jgi:hypothetical protein
MRINDLGPSWEIRLQVFVFEHIRSASEDSVLGAFVLGPLAAIITIIWRKRHNTNLYYEPHKRQRASRRMRLAPREQERADDCGPVDTGRSLQRVKADGNS